jgi:hypothetical protein
MTRQGLRILEQTSWIVGGYLFLCVLNNPPMLHVLRIVDKTAAPPKLLSEKKTPDNYPHAGTFVLVPCCGWMSVGARYGSGSITHHRESTVEIDFLRGGLWLGGISAVMLAAVAFLRRQIRRSPESLRGFEVVFTQTNAPAATNRRRL